MITDEFVKSQKILHLTTINPKGIPHIVPVWYLYSAKKFYIGTNTKTVKARNLQHNNRVAFCIDTGINAPDIYGITGDGTAKLILEQKQVRKIAVKILCRYFKTIADSSAQELLDDTDCIIEILPNKTAKWHY